MMQQASRKNILIIQCHPSREHQSFCDALAREYEAGAKEVGFETAMIRIATLAFDPILHEGYKANQQLEPDIADAQEHFRRADHLVFVYPMWQFMPPALLKGFLERTFTQDFAFQKNSENPAQQRILHGKSARLIQTSGMPGLIYRLWFQAHGAKALRDLLAFCGIAPVRISYFGMIESSEKKRLSYLSDIRQLGMSGS